MLNLPTFLTALEAAVIAAMLEGSPECGSAIAAQLAQSELVSREHNGYGFYTTFLVAPATQPLAFVHKIIHANALVGGELCGFILWMNDAKVDFLEGYPLGGDAWPNQETFEQVRLS